MRSKVISDIPQMIEECATFIRSTFQCPPNLIALVKLPCAILFLLLSPFVAFTGIFFATASDLLEGTASSFPPDDTRVPTFYVPKHEYGKWFQVALLLSLSAAFGGIHCAGWDYLFPTYAEQTLWRVASLAVTILPIVAFPLGQIVVYPPPFQHPNQATDQPYKPVKLAGGIIVILAAFAYVAARFILIGLALSLLRHIFPNALIAINWIAFYPHIS